ncbi:response regulator [Desulfococcaceae bacterium HSG9]|nr:response regulator [Desulfococcaceae bacterium HSG9]
MDTVLIVDDDPMLLTILTESLKKYRNIFEIVIAKDGLAAIKIMQQQRFQLVITDLHMPMINGLVLLSYINKNYPKVPCIVMTAFGTPFLKKRLQQDISHYIEKPFEIEELVQAIISALDQEVLSGTLNGISLNGFLKMIELEYKTCLCEVTESETAQGYLYFERGLLYHAFYGHLRGVDAALRMLQMDSVTIRFRKPPSKKIPRIIENDLSTLITEAARIKEKMFVERRNAVLEKKDRKLKEDIQQQLQTEEIMKKAQEQAADIEHHISDINDTFRPLL